MHLKTAAVRFAIVAAAIATTAWAAHAAAGNGDDAMSVAVPVLGEMVVILLLAKLGGHAAIRLGQPAVLGELGAGMFVAALLGAVSRDGNPLYLMEAIGEPDSHLHVLAEMGVVLLLYRVGLESNFTQLLKVGRPAMLVAVTGIVLPVVCGAAVCALLGVGHIPGESNFQLYLFVGATMAATSVGMTARVFEDLHMAASREARIVLGAAVIDDILGLLVFAVMSGLMFTAAGASDAVLAGTVIIILAKTAVFFIIVGVLGRWFMPPVFRWLLRLRGEGVAVAIALAFCFGMAYLSSVFQLATIVGAFLAGLMINNRYFPAPDHAAHGHRYSRPQLERMIDPLYQILAPVFFVILGMQVQFDALADWGTVAYALTLVVVAIATKVVAGFWVPGTPRARAIVGVGMIPRGEVGLIFASMGLTSGFIDDATYSALILMVFATTLVTPPALKLLIGDGLEGEPGKDS